MNFAAAKSLKEWLCNIRKAQNEKGAIPGIVPTGGWGHDLSGPIWEGACVTLPYYVYKFDGDKSVIEDNTSMILRYLYYIMEQRNEDGLIDTGLGDWLQPNAFSTYWSSPQEVTSTLEIIDIAKKAAHLFKETGKKYAEEFALRIAEDLTIAFRKHLIDFDTMTVRGDCQTSQALAIARGIFKENEKAAAMKKLIEIIQRNNGEGFFGMVGGRYIYHVLIDNGYAELAYKMMMSEDKMGYGYILKTGETSLPESRVETHEAVDSRNHHLWGDCASITIQEFAGLKPNPNVNDTSYFEISLHFIADLTFAEAHYTSMYGKVSCRWERIGDKICLTVTAPKGVHGTIKLHNGYLFNNSYTKRICEGTSSYKIYKAAGI